VAARIDADRLWPGRPVSSGRMDAQELDGDAGVLLRLVTGLLRWWGMRPATEALLGAQRDAFHK